MTSEIDAARLLLDRLGINPTDLLSTGATQLSAPTLAEYLPTVAAAVTAGARTNYLPYWHRAATYWPDRPLDQVTATDIGALTEHIRATALPRRNTRDGRCAAEHTIAALRCLFHHAIADGLTSTNPASHVAKPRRLPSTALPHHQIAAIHHTAATTGNDPALDTLLLRLHAETACRRGGALALRPCDLDPEQCLIRLREKGGTVRWQPVSPTLMTHLQTHHQARTPPDTNPTVSRPGFDGDIEHPEDSRSWRHHGSTPMSCGGGRRDWRLRLDGTRPRPVGRSSGSPISSVYTRKRCGRG